MNRVSLSQLLLLAAARRPALALRKQVFSWAFAVLPLWMGCAQFVPSRNLSAPAAASLPEMDSPTDETPPTTSKSLAIDLDTVFRLAEDQNAQVALPLARVR